MLFLFNLSIYIFFGCFVLGIAWVHFGCYLQRLGLWTLSLRIAPYSTAV